MKTVVITGATSGIGEAVCTRLLKSGCRVIGIGRSEERCRKAEERFREAIPGGNVTFYPADLLCLDEIRAVAHRIREDLEKNSDGKLDALVSNAGCVRSWYMTTPEGYEHQFALNHLAGFLMTHELLASLRKARGRILLTSSGSHLRTRVRWKDVMFEKRYHPLLAYKQSKLCNLLFARGLNDLYGESGLHAYGVDPGLVKTDIGNKSTGGLVGFVWNHRKKHGVAPDVPARIYEQLVTADPAPGCLYHDINGVSPPSREVNSVNAGRLFALSERLLNIKFGVNESCMS